MNWNIHEIVLLNEKERRKVPQRFSYCFSLLYRGAHVDDGEYFFIFGSQVGEVLHLIKN
jgi:hypothetical protein